MKPIWSGISTKSCDFVVNGCHKSLLSATSMISITTTLTHIKGKAWVFFLAVRKNNMIRTIKSLIKHSLKGLLNKQRASWLMAGMLLLFVGQAYAMNLMKDFDGAYHSLDEYTGKGKWAVVMIWASDCQACNQEATNYVKFNKEHKEKDAFILGISTDGREKKAEAVKFIERHGVDFNNLIDEPGNVARLYSSLTGQPFVGTPTFLLFSPVGELRAAQVGAVPTEIIESFIAKETLAAKNKAAEKVTESP